MIRCHLLENLLQKLERQVCRSFEIKNFQYSSTLIYSFNEIIDSLLAVQENTLRSNSFDRSMTSSVQNRFLKSSARNSIFLDASRLSDQQKNLRPEELKGIYLKKLQNNFYDRKLWNTLVNSNNLNKSEFNIYTERTIRNYDNEFSILTQSDWAESKFVKSISRYCESLVNFTKNDTENSRSDTISANSSIRALNNSQLTTYQNTINKNNKEIRIKHLKSLMKFIPVIKTWSNAEKQSLLMILLEHQSKSNLQHLVECVDKK